jgi:ABC-2 type transport system permease protein
MRTLMFLLQKEFRQIFRNRIIIRMILAVPVIQLLILPMAADFEIRNINISIVDHDRSPYSQKLASKIGSSGYFRIIDYGNSYNKAFSQIESDETDLVLEIPQDFERNLFRESGQQLFIGVNAINGAKANVGGVYLIRVIADFNNEIRSELVSRQNFNATPTIEVADSNWFNPDLNYRTFMVPGILVLLVTMVGVYMCALNLVKEKETGTIEQINVTPVRKIHFILGKLIPFWIIGMFIFSIGLFLIARLVYGIVPAGSIALLYAYLGMYLVAVLGIGLLISTYSDTQQQAMSLMFFFMMIFILMSGLFTPVDSMPEWAKWITRMNPVTYFIEVMRMVVMKGSGLHNIIKHFIIMAGFAGFFNTWAILNYRKTSR